MYAEFTKPQLTFLALVPWHCIYMISTHVAHYFCKAPIYVIYLILLDFDSNFFVHKEIESLHTKLSNFLIPLYLKLYGGNPKYFKLR